jgi:hypothetical protein
VSSGLRDVGDYFDRMQGEWERRHCTAEPLEDGGQIFEYEVDEIGRDTGRGHLLARISFAGFEDAYLAAEDWLVPHRGYIEREFYAYDLIISGGRLDNWHRHYDHGDHRHHGGGRTPIPRTTLVQAIEKCLDIIYSGRVPDE